MMTQPLGELRWLSRSSSPRSTRRPPNAPELCGPIPVAVAGAGCEGLARVGLVELSPWLVRLSRQLRIQM
jgi:hypothetical protein